MPLDAGVGMAIGGATMTATALAIYVVFALLAFAWRAWLQYRRTGDPGFRGFAGRIGSVEWSGGALLTLGACAGLVAIVADLGGGAQRFRLIPPALVPVSGLALMVLGAVLTFVAQLEMGSSWRIGVQSTEVTELITTGLFRWVRNPIFAAMLVVLLGVLLTVPNLIASFAFAVSLIGSELHVRRVEEPYLIRIHGERYRAYAQRVGRFVPGIGRIT
jgi:protein-S-isoprenylcysteine O-methyltransferase Ste14